MIKVEGRKGREWEWERKEWFKEQKTWEKNDFKQTKERIEKRKNIKNANNTKTTRYQ